MLVRFIVSAACVVLFLVVTQRRAEAADPPPSLLTTIERFFASFRGVSLAARERSGEALGRDASATSLGIRPRGMSMVGASLATVGAGGGAAWLLVHRGHAMPAIAFGPRLYPGGGGVGFSVRW